MPIARLTYLTGGKSVATSATTEGKGGPKSLFATVVTNTVKDSIVCKDMCNSVRHWQTRPE